MKVDYLSYILRIFGVINSAEEIIKAEPEMLGNIAKEQGYERIKHILDEMKGELANERV